MADTPQFPPTIELDGARLRPLRVADADALYDYLRDPAVKRAFAGAQTKGTERVGSV